MADTPLHIPELGGKFIDYRQGIWGNSFTWSWERPITQVQFAAIHHTVTDINAHPDVIAALHKARGWSGIGYHFVIPGNGNVYYCGDISTARANVKNQNEKVIGIALCGDFTKHLPTDEQIDSAHKLVNFFIEQASIPGINSWDSMRGHQEFQATACPGSSWKGAPDSMFERIKNNIPYTPQPPTEPPIDPDPEPPVDPTPPIPPADCCEELDIRLTSLEAEVDKISKMTLWDWLKR